MSSSYDQRFQVQLAQRRSQADARQRFLDQMYAKMEAEEAQRIAAEEEAASQEKLNWFDDAAKGAQYGSAVGPWGALIGGAIGTVKGQVESYQERKKRDPNQAGFGRFMETVTDTPFGFNVAGLAQGNGRKGHYGRLTNEAMQDMALAGTNSYSSYKADQARKSTARGTAGGPTQIPIGSAIPAGTNMPRPIESYGTGYSTGPTTAELYESRRHYGYGNMGDMYLG